MPGISVSISFFHYSSTIRAIRSYSAPDYFFSYFFSFFSFITCWKKQTGPDNFSHRFLSLFLLQVRRVLFPDYDSFGNSELLFGKWIAIRKILQKEARFNSCADREYRSSRIFKYTNFIIQIINSVRSSRSIRWLYFFRSEFRSTHSNRSVTCSMFISTLCVPQRVSRFQFVWFSFFPIYSRVPSTALPISFRRSTANRSSRMRI